MLLKKSNETETKLSDGEIDSFQVEEEASDSLNLTMTLRIWAKKPPWKRPKLEIITKKKASVMDIEPEYRGRRNGPTPVALCRHRLIPRPPSPSPSPPWAPTAGDACSRLSSSPCHCFASLPSSEPTWWGKEQRGLLFPWRFETGLRR